jgi:hypothetical protein
VEVQWCKRHTSLQRTPSYALRHTLSATLAHNPTDEPSGAEHRSVSATSLITQPEAATACMPPMTRDTHRQSPLSMRGRKRGKYLHTWHAFVVVHTRARVAWLRWRRRRREKGGGESVRQNTSTRRGASLPLSSIPIIDRPSVQRCLCQRDRRACMSVEAVTWPSAIEECVTQGRHARVSSDIEQ